jgi:hypothetical protein
MKKKEIFSSCCAIGGLTEEVHALMTDCPIKRQEGSREVESFFGKDKGEKRHECTCIYISSFSGGVRPCEHYKGIKQVQRNKKKVWKIFCEAVGESE